MLNMPTVDHYTHYGTAALEDKNNNDNKQQKTHDYTYRPINNLYVLKRVVVYFNSVHTEISYLYHISYIIYPKSKCWG